MLPFSIKKGPKWPKVTLIDFNPIELGPWVQPSGIFCSGLTLASRTARCFSCFTVSGISRRTFLLRLSSTSCDSEERAGGRACTSLSDRLRVFSSCVVGSYSSVAL